MPTPDANVIDIYEFLPPDEAEATPLRKAELEVSRRRVSEILAGCHSVVEFAKLLGLQQPDAARLMRRRVSGEG